MAKFKPTRKHFIYGMTMLATLGISMAVGVFAVFNYKVYFGDNTYLKKSTIIARINEETQIYFDDEVSPLGSFFESSHRQYVPIEDIPAHMINAIVASEDKNFYNHSGIDYFAILRAAFGMIKSGRIVGGGSTLTQQTVKNILNRWDNTFQRKFFEAIAAKQLENLYDKKQILEFYLNQFHVTANGRGLGVAATYYFNKRVQDLTLVEAAFIAGSVKGPSKYNPFMKYTKEARQQARVNANHRKNYVLKRMYTQDWISEEEFKEAYELEVPFNRGKFRSRQVNLAQTVRSLIDRKEILEAINLETIDDLNKSGYRIYTTLDKDLQESGQLATRRNLSRLETILSGFEPYPPETFKPLRLIEQNHFYFGKVTEIIKDKGKEELKMTFGHRDAVVLTDGLVRYAKLLDLPNGIGWEKQLNTMLKKIKVDDVLYTEVKEITEDNIAVLEIHKHPKINGGLAAIDKGDIKAIISGFDTGGFNRALHAKRPPGSVFKSVVFYAAMQLGWSVLDRLDNQRQVFPFQGEFYYPRPDHRSPYADASMMWAGIMSENLASVYLTYHLLDKINYDQFKQLIKNLGFEQDEDESQNKFLYRIAKDFGVSVREDGIKERQLFNAIKELQPDLIFSGQEGIMRDLNKMWWGRNYEEEITRLNINVKDIPEEEQTDQKISTRERLLRIDLVKNNFQRMEKVATLLSEDWNMINQAIEEEGLESALGKANIKEALKNFRVMASQGRLPELGYFHVFENEELQFKAPDRLEDTFNRTSGRPLNSFDIKAIWGSSSLFSRSSISISDVKLEGYLPLEIFLRLKSKVTSLYENVVAKDDPDGLYRYYQHQDFRVILGLRYLVDLVKSMGVYSEVQPVLSFPLGTNELSVAEITKIYQTFITGKIYRFRNDPLPNQLNVIKRIEDRSGNVLYVPQKEERILALPEFSVQMRQILRKIVTNGTGRRAHRELYVATKDKEDETKDLRISIPAYGKTGTTNDYTTSYFAGFIPYPTEEKQALDPFNSYTIAAYVGYDLNEPMRNGRLRISGAMGALPLWTDFGKFIIEKKKYEDYIDFYDLDLISRKIVPTKPPADTSKLLVDLPRGLVLKNSGSDNDESIETTNIQLTGEIYESEFALGHRVSSAVYLPRDKYASRGWSPLRLFSPYVNFTLQELQAVSPTSMQITPDEGTSPDLLPYDPPAAPKDEASESSLKPNRQPSKPSNVPIPPTPFREKTAENPEQEDQPSPPDRRIVEEKRAAPLPNRNMNTPPKKVESDPPPAQEEENDDDLW